MHCRSSKSKNILRGAVLALLIGLAGPGAARAQGSSPLAGKTVHLLNPFKDALPLLDLSGTGYTMAEEGPNWYRFDFNSIGGSLQTWMNSFQIRTADWKRFGPKGMTTTDAPFGADLFGAGTDIWIVIDPAGPSDGPPLILTKAPGTVHLFNPWPANGPKMILNGKPIPMTVDGKNCGWYVGYTLPITPLDVYFTNVADAQPWGKGGYDDKTPFDLVALFASKGTDLWIASQTEITGTNPGKLGSCTYQMAATVHDMAIKHPDYGSGGGGPGMVQSALGPDHKPVPTTAAPGHFNTWFNSDPNAAAPLKGAETCLNLEMGKSDDGLWEYDDEKNMPAAGGFFPIDDWNTLDANTTCSEVKHNYGFCLESHATFVYQKGQVFDFRGDDDVWVFINNKLALDIGGIHPATPGTINLDSLGLKEGQTYPWDFFFCERNMCGSSLRIKTTIYFKQQRALDHAEEKLPGGGTNYKVIKRIGGTGACGSSGDSLKEVAPGPLTFVLYKVGGDSIQDLPKGISFGGINVGDAAVTVDTSKVTGLAAGQYRIVFYETGSPRLRDEVRFTVSPHNMVEFDPPYAIDTVLGSVVRLIAANRFKDSIVAQAVPWTPIFPAGVSVYADAGLKTKINSKTQQTTDATGFDTLWVTGDPAALDNQSYIFSIQGSSKTVKVTFKLPPLDLPKALTAFLYDDNGDGRGDRLEINYDRDITATLPKALAYRWPATNGADSSLGTDFASKLQAGGKTLVFSGKAVSSAILTAGTGVVKSTYAARGKDSVQNVTLEEKMGPVIRTASMHLGPSLDTLILEFSEPIAGAAQAAKPEDLFGYKLGDSSAVVAIAPQGPADWAKDGASVSLVFASNATPEPKAGDFVRLNDGPGLAADAAGNRPGSQTQFHIITGDKRTGILTVTYREIPPDPALFTGPTFQPSLEASGADVKAVVEKTGRMGHLLQADLADYAAGDGLVVPEPSQVSLDYTVALFTNHGVPVASETRSLLCTDAIFQGDCRTHRGRLFVGWNYTARSRNKVATGAYVALFEYKVKVSGKTEASGSLKQVWGLLRKR